MRLRESSCPNHPQLPLVCVNSTHRQGLPPLDNHRVGGNSLGFGKVTKVGDFKNILEILMNRKLEYLNHHLGLVDACTHHMLVTIWTLPPRRTCSDLSSSGHVAATCRVGGMTLESANTAAPRALHWQQPWRRAAIIFKVALRAMLLEQLFPGGRWVENSQWNRSLLESDFLFRGKWAICIN